jgi:O-antigen ligase
VLFIGSSPFFLLKYIITNDTRFLLMLLFFIYFLGRKIIFRYWDTTLFSVVMLYVIWCFLSSFWSLVPTLSFVKAIILFIVSFSFITAGIEWVKSRPIQHSIDYLWFLATYTILLGVLGLFTGGSYVHSTGDIRVYKGLLDQSNLFGSILLMSMPYLFWKTYSNWHQFKRRLVYLTMTALAIYFLVLTVSRASILGALIFLLFFLLSLPRSSKMIMLILTTVIAINFMVFTDNSAFVEKLNHYMYKGQANQKLLMSRLGMWEITYKGAVEGGWTGLGYGASLGHENNDLTKRLNNNTYIGTEKSNVPLAIVEETGLVGLVFYYAMILVVLYKLLRLFLSTKVAGVKVLIGIITGIIFGMLAHSFFEDWWSAASAPESMYFWLLIGIVRGLEIARIRDIHFPMHQFQSESN